MNEKRIRQVVIWAVSLVAVVVTAGFAFAMWENFSDGPRPDTSDLMPRRVAIPDSDNGFLLLNSGTFPVPWDHSLVTTDRSSTKKWDQAKVDAVLASDAPTLALFDKAMTLPGYQGEEIKSLAQRFGYLTFFMDIGHLETLSSLNHWKQGKRHVAMRQNLQTLEFGHRILSSGGFIHFLVGLSVESMAAGKLSRFAEEASKDDEEDLKSAIVQLGHCENHTEALNATLRNEFMVWDNTIEGIASSRVRLDDLLALGTSSGTPPRLPFQPNNTRVLIAETFRQIIRESSLPYDKIDKEPGAIKTLGRQSGKSLWLSVNGGGRMLYAMAIPVDMTVVTKKYRVTATIRMTRALLAVRCYWLDHGKFPATLDDLVPAYLDAVPLDPYDGKPLRYSPSNKVIYSIGKDLADHGGDPSENNSEGDKQPTVKIGW